MRLRLGAAPFVVAAVTASFGTPFVAGADPAAAATPPVVTVAADGTGTFTTVQAAVDAVPAGNRSRFLIRIRPGVYAGQVIVPATKPFVTFVGLGGSPSDVVIVDNRANGTPKPGGGTWGTTGSASVTISGHDFAARNLTFANAFDEAGHPEITSPQAVAVLTNADRAVFDGVRFLANQDTLYVNSPSTTVGARAYFHNCYVEGDVDFIFGRGTAVFDRCEIHSLNRGSTTNNGYVTAASTSIGNPFGFLFSACQLTASAPAGTVSLGRPWHPSGDPNAIAQVVFRESAIGGHINPTGWTDFGTFSWQDARYFEYHDTGPGAAGPGDPNRPQLDDATAATVTPAAYLTGADGWSPLLP